MAEQSRETQLLSDIIDSIPDGGVTYDKPPQSRNEEILLSILNDTEYTKTPQSREEELLLELKEKIGGLVPPVPPVIKRVTGNPVEFSDGADAPLLKCVTEIQGSQDLHGQGKPWPPGGGKNKLVDTYSQVSHRGVNATINNGVVELSGTASSGNAFIISDYVTLPARTYTVTGIESGSMSTYNAYIEGATTEVDIGNGFNFTIGESTQIRYVIRIYQGVNVTGVKVYPMIRLATETDPTFAPYSNICPITAYTEGEIEVRGKNLWSLGDIEVATASGLTLNLHAGTYTVFASPPQGKNLAIRFYYTDDESFVVNPITTTPTTFTAEKDIYKINVNVPGLVSGEKVTQIQIEKGSTATTYEPYTSTAHTTAYPSAIYRGSEDVVNGEVTSEWAKVVFDGSNDEAWELQSINSYGIANFQISLSSSSTHRLAFISNYLPCQDSLISQTSTEGFFTNERLLFIRLNSTRASTVEELRTWLSNNNFEVTIELAIPTTTPVTPTNLPIKSLSDYNHIESSTGDMTIDYITDEYQNFVDTTERALPNTRKGGIKALDIFLSLESKEEPTEEKGDTK